MPRRISYLTTHVTSVVPDYCWRTLGAGYAKMAYPADEGTPRGTPKWHTLRQGTPNGVVD
jgi:hypothetical protein